MLVPPLTDNNQAHSCLVCNFAYLLVILVPDLKQVWPSTDGPTAHLHATFEVMPHSKTRSYFSWHCFQLVCRHLFSVAKCSATLNIPTTQQGKLVEHMDNLHYYLSKVNIGRSPCVFKFACTVKYGQSAPSLISATCQISTGICEATSVCTCTSICGAKPTCGLLHTVRASAGMPVDENVHSPA